MSAAVPSGGRSAPCRRRVAGRNALVSERVRTLENGPGQIKLRRRKPNWFHAFTEAGFAFV
ncbi:hypothetical protein GCM10007301_09100 [Azorhizobium oxalatiphilum]|uniref:Uncharacterized protein n=1 Tax=Azorhizobium oxalatiphilum TaxID=980631 RepID=A0A917F670_9HYPH|nr:hypothetical protein GCM10007301_09100 [Azorhizobium oxalatiphilum]